MLLRVWDGTKMSMYVFFFCCEFSYKYLEDYILSHRRYWIPALHFNFFGSSSWLARTCIQHKIVVNFILCITTVVCHLTDFTTTNHSALCCFLNFLSLKIILKCDKIIHHWWCTVPPMAFGYSSRLRHSILASAAVGLLHLPSASSQFADRPSQLFAVVYGRHACPRAWVEISNRPMTIWGV